MTDSAEPKHPSTGGRSKRPAILRLALLAAIVVAALVVAYLGGSGAFGDAEALSEFLRDVRGIPGIRLLFILAFGIATALGFPATALTLAGGAIFDFGWGFFLNWMGVMLGATLGYGMASVLGRDSVRRLLGHRVQKLDTITAEHGFWAMFRLRLIPVIPFLPLNFSAALAGVRVRDYIPATALGLIPFIGVYTYFADVLIAGVAGARERALWNIAIAGALLILLSFAPAILRKLGIGGETD